MGHLLITVVVTQKVKNMFIFSFLPLSLMDIPIIPETVSGFQKFLLALIILALLTLWSFIDIVGHFITLYLIDYTKAVEKYPKLKPVLNYFKKTNYIFLGIEIGFFISIYLMLIGICIKLYFVL